MIRFLDVSFGYDGQRVLSEISFEVSADETVAVMGANGSGKTTLLRLLSGLRDPDTGVIEVDGLAGFAPEDPQAGLFARTVAEEIEFFPRNRGLDAARESARAMQKMDISHLQDRNPFTLSVGEQRRVSIASVLAGDPAVLALDEPTVGLHAAGERRLGALLSELDTTVVLSTHATDFAYQFVDRVVVLSQGLIQREGAPREVLSDLEFLDEAGIRPPGIVAWASQQGIDRMPSDLDEAMALVRRGR